VAVLSKTLVVQPSKKRKKFLEYVTKKRRGEKAGSETAFWGDLRNGLTGFLHYQT